MATPGGSSGVGDEDATPQNPPRREDLGSFQHHPNAWKCYRPPPRMGHVQHQAKFLSFSPSIRHKMPTRRGHGEMLPFPIINEGQGGAPKALG